MKKINFLLLILLLFGLASCDKKTDTPKTDADFINVFPVSSYNDTLKVTLGDVMPFYDNGVMNIYHLQNTVGTNSKYYHPISRLTTTDFVHYNDEGIAINFEEDPRSPDAALGTGSFIKDADGIYHAFYTGHNDISDSGLRYIEVIRHATSPDQVNWTKDATFNLYGESNDFRDPFVYYDDIDAVYYMLVTTRTNDDAVIKQYKSNTLNASSDDWEDCGIFYNEPSSSYNMECPSYYEYNGYYYLMFSEQGDNRVTHYRYKKNRNGEWLKFDRDTIDASGFYAGRLEKALDKLYAFAWCANLTGGVTGSFDWGGNLVVHRITQESNGELNAILIDSVKEFYQNKVNYKDIAGKKVSSLSFKEGEFKCKAFDKLSKKTLRLSFEFSIDSVDGDFGLTFNTSKKDNMLGSAIISFDAKNKSLICYNSVSNIIRYGTPLAQMAFLYQKNTTYTVDMIIEGEVISCYLNNTIALTVRLPGITNKNFGFYANNLNVVVKEINFYE